MWLMRMHQIRILYIFVPNLQELLHFFIKNRFFRQFKAHLASRQPKIGFSGKKRYFLVNPLGSFKG